jgi:PHS family inorganic phosphate transporter-like MFS transporter
MIIFSHLADRLGRKKLYGLELGMIIFALIGLALSSNGTQPKGINLDGNTTGPAQDRAERSSMDLRAAIIFWRVILGVGVGAGISHLRHHSSRIGLLIDLLSVLCW